MSAATAGRGAQTGLHRAARARMSEVQRARILAAAEEVVSEHGYRGMSTARITERAGISRRTFYELFDDREDCFLALFDETVERIAAVARPAYERERRWREQVRAGLSALLQFIGDEPGLGSLLIVDALGAGPKVLERRARWLETLTSIVDRGRSEVKTRAVPPRLTAEGLIGAVLSVLHARVLERDGRPLVGLLNPLMAMIVLPYLGQGAATRELARPRPRSRRAPSRSMRDALGGLQIRITYRTLRVLAAIEEHPGASNREIATVAEVSDQGQISRLLARLEKHGLIGNSGLGQPTGEPNAWTLTAAGADLQRAVRTQTDG